MGGRVLGITSISKGKVSVRPLFLNVKELALDPKETCRTPYGDKSVEQVEYILTNFKTDRVHACRLKPRGMLVFHGYNGWRMYFLDLETSWPANFCPGCGTDLKKVTK